MTKTCHWCSIACEITAADFAFYDKVLPVFNGKKYPIPPPNLCPACREKRRLVLRNERTLYGDTCDLCHKEIISHY